MSEPRLDEIFAALPTKYAPWMTAIDQLAKTDLALAELGLERVIARFPGVPQTYFRYARAAALRRDWPEAERRWALALARFPDAQIAAMGQFQALAQLGQSSAAEALVQRLLAEPVSPRSLDPAARRGLRIELARLKQQAGENAEARRLWAELLAEAPEDPEICRGHGEAQLLAFYAGDSAETDAPFPVSSDAALFAGFESLGANCEFGFVQRHYGAEPIGLLRWVGITAPRLVTALQTRFEGIGEPEFTRLEARVTPANEIIMHDSRYGLRMHTFVRNTGQDLDALQTQIMRRMRFTRRKLLEDLEEGAKTFVYRQTKQPKRDFLTAILAELRRYNPDNWLLAIDPTPPGEAPAKVERIGENLLYGSLPDASPPQLGDPWTLAPALWRDALLAARNLREAATPRP